MTLEGLTRLAKILLIAVPVVGAIVGIAVFLAGLLLAEAVLIGLVIVFVLLAALLWYVRDGLLVRLGTAQSTVAATTRQNTDLQNSLSRLEGVEIQRRELQTQLEAKTGQLAERDERVSLLEREKAKLSEEAARLRAETEALQATNDALQTRVAGSEASVARLTGENARLLQGLHDEQVSTARAPHMPAIDVSHYTTGFGILSAKSVHIRVRNVGRGNALNVQVSTASGRGPVQGAVSPRDFWPVITPTEPRDLVIGDLDDFGGDTWIRVVVAFDSQFGPCGPVDISWPVPT